MGRQRKRTGPSSRPIQVGEQVRHALAEMIGDGSIKDPRMKGASIITVTDVEMTPDLKTARVYVSVFPDDETVVKSVFAGLNSARQQMKREIAARLSLRYTPDLQFHVDKSMAVGARIEEILREVAPSEVPDLDLDDEDSPED